jgi:sugar phosphate isomerase/epimerase
MGQHEPLYLGHFSVAHVPPKERFAAAAAAGFDAISISWGEVTALRDQGEMLDTILDGLALAGIDAAQLEFATLGVPGPVDAFVAEAEAMAVTASALGCSAVHAVAVGADRSAEQLATQFGALCDATAAVGLPCGVEFVYEVSAVQTLRDAIELVRAVDRPNAGVVVDSMHFFRGGEDWDALAELSPHEVVAIQINDLPRRAELDYMTEAVSARLLPGEGDLDLPRFIATLDMIPRAVPLTVEVPNSELMAMEPEAAATRMATTTRKLLGSSSLLGK